MEKIKKTLTLAVLSLGFTSIITQIILLREFLSVFYGNELVIGIILANWMALTGLGAYLGKFSEQLKIKQKHLAFPFIALAVLPIVTVFLLNYLKNIVFIAGSMIGIVQIFYSSFILLLPYCLLSGFLFTLLAGTVSGLNKSNLISKVYSIESIGSIIGGIIFNFILIFFLKTFQSLTILLITNLVLANILIYKYNRRTTRYISLIASVVALVIVFNFNFDELARQFLFKDQEIIFYKDTPYGNLTVAKQGEQKNFFENNVLFFSTNDPASNEEAVHYAMIQHPNPKNVLLIGGGISGTTNEVLKYNVERIDYVEVNPWIIQIGKTYTDALNDKRINVLNEDGRLFVKSTPKNYDVVLINLPEPITAQLNRFYTTEFFIELKTKLNRAAVVSLSLLPATDYISQDARQINSIIYHTLKTAFKNILIVPGMKNYFLASDSELNINIGKMIEQRGLNNLYVNQYYLDDEILHQRSEYIQSNILTNTKLNKDFNPVSYYRQILHWLSYFEVNYWIPSILILLGLVLLLLKLNPISFGVFCGGFAASSIEVLLLIVFQIIYGYVYQVTGIIITIFMAGLAVGSFYWNKIFSQPQMNHFIKIQFLISIYSLLLPLIFILLKSFSINAVIVHSIFYLLTFIIAFLVALEFSLATKLESGNVSKVASKIYGVDLIGSAFGALLVSAFLIPLLGIIMVSLVIGLLNLISGIISFYNRRKYSSLF
ncbi:MAG: fused MFS/spermidine synthase [Ignavibacteriales bacterium]|nr:fused MFS/spermidine synthase [Ignavibacteriales bacterium]